MKKILFILSALLLIPLSYGQNTVIRLALNDNEPYLNAGSDQTITTLDSILISARTRNLDSLVWRTDGTGTFTDTTAKPTYYTPSEADYLADSVVLTIVGYALAGQDTLYNEKILYFNDIVYITLVIGQSNIGVVDSVKIPTDSISKYQGEINNAYIYNRIGSTEWEQIHTGKNTEIDYYNGIIVNNSWGITSVLGYNLGGYYIQSGRGSTSLSTTDWLGGNIYDSTLLTISNAMQLIDTSIILIDKVVWIQGERDCQSIELANNYESNLNLLFNNLQTDINNLYNNYEYSFKKYIVKVNDSAYVGTSHNARVDTVQYAQSQYTIKNTNVSLIDGWDCSYSDTHYDSLGIIDLGWKIINSFNYNEESNNLFARIDHQPDDTMKIAINQLIDTLKNYNVWDTLDVCYYFASCDSQAALLNWKDTLFDATLVDAPLFAVNEGFTTNGTSSYIKTNFNPVNGDHWYLNSSSLAYYIRTNTITTTTYMTGIGSTNYSGVYSDGTNIGVRINATGGPTYAHSNNLLGLTIATRKTNSNVYLARNSGGYVSGTRSSTAIPNHAGGFYVGCLNNNGTAQSYTNQQFSHFSAGGQLTVTQKTKLFEATERYMDFLGKGVIE